MRLRILTPGLLDFRETLGAAQHDPEAYARLWARFAHMAGDVVQRESPEEGSPQVEVSRTAFRGRFNRYAQIDTDTLERPVEALLLRLTAADVELETPGLIQPHADHVRIECRVYDHGIFLLEAEVQVALPDDLEDEWVPAWLDALQRAAVTWGERLAHQVHERYLTALLAAVRSIDRGGAVVESAADGADRGHVASDDGNVLWVTRSLRVDLAEPFGRAVAKHWVKDASGGASATFADDHGHVIRWLNYLFVRPESADTPAHALTDEFVDEWTGLRLAQYFYAALENIDTQLTRVLAQSLSKEARASIRQLQEQLQDCARRAEFITMFLRDVSKYVTRAVREELDAILQYWDFDEVVERPVRTKIEACERRLSELAEQRNARAGLFTDTILLGIGVTSILGTTVALTEFGRQMAVDPGMAGYDGARGDVTSWIAAQPADLLLMAAVGVSVLLTVVYTYFRRSHRG